MVLISVFSVEKELKTQAPLLHPLTPSVEALTGPWPRAVELCSSRMKADIGKLYLLMEGGPTVRGRLGGGSIIYNGISL